MARLGQIVKRLNIGSGTAVGFLSEKGHQVSDDPNAKLTKEQESILMEKFATPDMLAELKEKKATRAPKREKVLSKPEEIKVEVPRVKIIDKIQLDEKGEPVIPVASVEKTEANVEEKHEADMPSVVEPAKVEVEPQVEKASEVSDSKPEPEQKKVEPAIEDEKPMTVLSPAPDEDKTASKDNLAKSSTTDQNIKVEPKQQTVSEDKKIDKHEPEIFTLRKTELGSNIKVVDKIDLSAINNNTRPPKKTKEERRKERIAKERQQQEARRANHNAEHQQRKENEIFNTETPKLQGPNVIDKIDLKGSESKKKRKRIGGERVDINKAQQNVGNENAGKGGKNKNKRSKAAVHTPVISEEDVARQVKETLARLTEGHNKGVKKGVKYRKEKREAAVQRMQAEQEQEMKESKVLKLTEFVTANELAAMMDVPVTQVIQTCFNLGLFVSINQRLDAETINIVADEFDYKTEFVSAEVVNAIQEEADAEEDLVPRPPIVTVMGHVDHGKTSLLDYIRNSNVIAGEAGGITQHIGAYNVKLESGRRITFLDTPGHEAFTAMRARGAKVTDVAIIIVAADDDVMPQTVEAINHASAAGVPIVFAINKIDKPTANPDKIKEALASMNYLVEEWGGKYQSQDISAKKGIGVKELLEKVLLEAELLDLKANPNRKASGSIIESSLDKGRGYVATVLISNGTLHVGDVMLAGTSYGRVKAMFNERNQRIKQAGPAEPVIVLGLNGAPQAGDNFNIFDEDHEAREIANKREQLAREQGLRTSKHLTLDEIGRRIALGNFQELNLIVKGDVDGSIEALSDSLLKLSTEEIQVNVIHKAVGQISESDVMLATASNAIIVGFQVRPSLDARKTAEREGVDIRLYSVIYAAIEEIKSAMEGMLAPDIKEEITATLEIRETFKISKVGTVAGCMVKEGKIKRTNRVRLIRDGIVIYTGELASLKRMKDDVKEVSMGYECGLNIANYNDIRIGDIVEAYEEVEVKKTL